MCSKTALKGFILILNVVLFLVGGVILGIGSWMVADKLYITEALGNSHFASASYLMVVTGVFIVLMAFLGCFGAITGNRCMIAIYTVTLVVLFILLLTAGIVAAVFYEDIKDNLASNLKQKIINNYGYNTAYDENNRKFTESWDLVQSKLKCCGVEDNSWGIYQSSQWFLRQGIQGNQFFPFNPMGGDRKYVPESCCVYVGNFNQYMNVQQCQTFAFGPPAVPYGSNNNALHYTGCKRAVEEKYLKHEPVLLVAIGFSFCVFLISAIVGGAMFYVKLGEGGSASFR